MCVTASRADVANAVPESGRSPDPLLIHVAPCSIATAACCASATRLPRACATRHRRSRISQWCAPGASVMTPGCSRRSLVWASASASGVGGLNTRVLVRMRTAPPSTASLTPTGSGLFTARSSHWRIWAWSGASARKVDTRMLTSRASIGVHDFQQCGVVVEVHPWAQSTPRKGRHTIGLDVGHSSPVGQRGPQRR